MSHVHYNYIRIQSVHQRQGFLDTACLTDNSQVWLDVQTHPQSLAYLGLPVHDQDSNHPRSPFCSSETSISNLRTLVL
jgi:hypothetical protein